MLELDQAEFAAPIVVTPESQLRVVAEEAASTDREVGSALGDRIRVRERSLVGAARQADPRELVAQACIGARDAVPVGGARDSGVAPSHDREPQ